MIHPSALNIAHQWFRTFSDPPSGMKPIAYEEAQTLPTTVAHSIPVRLVCLTHRFVQGALMRIPSAMIIGLKGTACLPTVSSRKIRRFLSLSLGQAVTYSTLAISCPEQ